VGASRQRGDSRRIFSPKIVAAYDDDIVRTFTRLLQKQGLKIETGAKVTGLRQRRSHRRTRRQTASLSPPTKFLVAVGVAGPSPTA
jgi:dihydrolipoamide dehydrogenase